MEASALRTSTELTATPIAACPDIMDWIAVGPNRAATAMTDVCRYDPAAACTIPLIITNAKKSPAGAWTYVLTVRVKARKVSHANAIMTRLVLVDYRAVYECLVKTQIVRTCFVVAVA